MRCANCGADVAEGTIFCPYCGHRLVGRTQPSPLREVYQEPQEPAPRQDRPSGCKWLALTGVFTLIFLVIVLGVGALAVYHGLEDQAREKRQLAQEHYAKGLDHMAQGSYELAIAEFEHAIRLDPDLSEAKLKLNEARSLLVVKPTPTTDSYRALADQLYREARTSYDQHDWEQAIAKLEELRVLDKVYQQQGTDTLLFWSYYYHGLALVNEGRMEEAVHRFDQALELQPNQPDAVGQRHLASIYVSGLRYWEADWEKAIEMFASLFKIEPNYRDVRQRLHDAHVRYGDLLAQEEAWCRARDQYNEALAIAPTQEIANRRDSAAQKCSAEPGETPKPGTPVAATPTAQPGVFIGQFDGYEDIRQITTEWVRVRGRVVNVAGAGVPGLTVKIQAFDWSGTAFTDINGEYGFDFLTHAVTYTLSLVEVPSAPVEVMGQFGMIAKVNFVETQ